MSPISDDELQADARQKAKEFMKKLAKENGTDLNPLYRAAVEATYRSGYFAGYGDALMQAMKNRN